VLSPQRQGIRSVLVWILPVTSGNARPGARTAERRPARGEAHIYDSIMTEVRHAVLLSSLSVSLALCPLATLGLAGTVPTGSPAQRRTSA
jgi:hypothetical protein